MRFGSIVSIIFSFVLPFFFVSGNNVLAQSSTPQPTVNADLVSDDLIGTWELAEDQEQRRCSVTLALETGQYGNKLYSCNEKDSYWTVEGNELVFKDIDGAETERFRKINNDRWESKSNKHSVHYISRMGVLPSATGEAAAASQTKPFELPGTASDVQEDLTTACSGAVSLEEALARGRQAALLHRDAESRCWLRKAGEQSSASVKFKVAMMYMKGTEGLSRNPVEAAYWLKWASAEGSAPATGFMACSTSEGKKAMLDLERQCRDTPPMVLLRSLLRAHCNEDQSLDEVVNVDVTLRANDPNVFRCAAYISAHIVQLSNDSSDNPECNLNDSLPTATMVSPTFDLTEAGSGNYTLHVHDVDADSIGACKNISLSFRPHAR